MAVLPVRVTEALWQGREADRSFKQEVCTRGSQVDMVCTIEEGVAIVAQV